MELNVEKEIQKTLKVQLEEEITENNTLRVEIQKLKGDVT